jgi:hypothetical protein
MKNSNVWTQPIHNQGLCGNVDYNFFRNKRYVSTKTSFVHLQELCSHWELKQYEGARSQYHFTLFCIWIQFIKPLTSNIILATWRRKLHYFPHLHSNLLALVFLWLLFICNCYTSFYNGKMKIYKNGHTKHFGNYDWIHTNLEHSINNMWNDNKNFGISERSNFVKTPK